MMRNHVPETLEPTSAQPVGSARESLAAVAVYGLLFALGWLGIFCFAFVPQGIPIP